jgi:rhamnosyltransferase subunit B
LGAGRGHAVRLAALERALAARGHEVIFAVQQIGSIATGEVWQAPLWPGQLTTLARRAATTPATMGDILAVLGLGDPGAASALIGAWDRMLAKIQPDVAVAEFAPGLMLAAHGRVPLLAIGTGFALPPPAMDRFPSLTGKPPVHEEGQLLQTVNQALARWGRSPRRALPGIFEADRTHAGVFTELDPYRRWRSEPVVAPSAIRPSRIASGDGAELFVYMNASEARPAAFWHGLVASRLKVRLYDPSLTPADREILANAGILVESQPVAFEMIVARSRLLLSHCGLGFVSSALMAGLPQILAPYDIEKRLIAASVEEMGLGRRMTFASLDAAAFAQFLRETFADDALSRRARAAAPGFRSRMSDVDGPDAARAIEELL